MQLRGAVRECWCSALPAPNPPEIQERGMTAEQDPLFEVQGLTRQPRYRQPKGVMSAETNRNKKYDGLTFTGDGLDGEWTYWSLAPEDDDWRHEFHGDRYEHLWLTG